MKVYYYRVFDVGNNMTAGAFSIIQALILLDRLRLFSVKYATIARAVGRDLLSNGCRLRISRYWHSCGHLYNDQDGMRCRNEMRLLISHLL